MKSFQIQNFISQSKLQFYKWTHSPGSQTPSRAGIPCIQCSSNFMAHEIYRISQILPFFFLKSRNDSCKAAIFLCSFHFPDLSTSFLWRHIQTNFILFCVRINLDVYRFVWHTQYLQEVFHIWSRSCSLVYAYTFLYFHGMFKALTGIDCTSERAAVAIFLHSTQIANHGKSFVYQRRLQRVVTQALHNEAFELS